jgi:hypothetical protein
VQFRTGFAREQAGDRAGAESAYRDAVAALTSAPPETRPPQAHLDLAFARMKLATVQFERGNYPAARKVVEESVEELRPFVARGDGPPNPAREWLGGMYWALGEVCDRTGDRTGAEQARQNARQYGDWFGGPKKDGPKKDGPPWGGKKDGPPKKDGPKG